MPEGRAANQACSVCTLTPPIAAPLPGACDSFAVIGSPAPELAAPVSVWAQFLVGVLLIPGFLTRWAGLLLAVNFLVAVALIGTSQGVFADVTRELFGPMMCVLAGLVLATQGPGGASLDARLTGRGSGPT